MAVKEEIMNLLRARRTPLITCLFLLLFTFLGQAAWARTISLLYDDSGSMKIQSRWLYANYATQALLALLREDDDLRLVYVEDSGSDNNLEFPLDRGRRAASIKKIYENHATTDKKNGMTPYAGVKAAAEALNQKSVSGVKALGAQEQNWLVVFTDGCFDCPGKQIKTSPQTAEEIRKHAKEFFDDPRGYTKNVRVIFLIIGEGTDDVAANIWLEAAGGDTKRVTILKASSSADVPGKMEEVARLINGRDEEQTDFPKNNDTIRFSTPFPLGRITIFEQLPNGGDFATLEKVLPPGGAATELEEPYDLRMKPHQGTKEVKGGGDAVTLVADPNGAKNTLKLAGRVSHAYGKGDKGQVMPPGEYTLQFDRPISEREHLQVLLEPQVDFEVQVLPEGQTSPLPFPENTKYEFCVNDKVHFRVAFTTTGQNLPIKKSDDNHMVISSTARGQDSGLKFTLDENSGQYQSTLYTVPAGETSLRVDVRYPGYIHMNSSATIVGGECLQNLSKPVLEPDTLSFSYVPGDTPVSVGTSELRRTENSYQADHTLSIPSIPKGIDVHVGGQKMEEGKAIGINFVQGSPLGVEVYANRKFDVAGSVPLDFQIKAHNPLVRHIPKLQLTLVPKPRRLFLASPPLEGSGPKPVRLDKLDEAKDLRFRFTVESKGVPVGELGDYEWDVTADKRFKAVVVPNSGEKKPGHYRLAVKHNSWLPFLTDPGDVTITLRVKGLFPGEEANTKIRLRIEDIPWWLKYGPLAVIGAVLIAAAIYGYALWKKPRFGRDNYIEYKHIMNPNTQNAQVLNKTAYYLAGWRPKYDGNRLANFLLRWFWPFGPEKRRVDGILFLASSTDDSIFVSGESVRANMKVGGKPVVPDGEPLAKEDLPLDVTDELTIDNQIRQTRKSYTYC